jgi:hypothetical protein
LVPFKHFVASEIEGALRHIFGGGELAKAPSGASESTLRRWRDEFSRQMQEWAGALEAMIFQQYHQAFSLVRLSCHPLQRLEAALSKLPDYLPAQWPVMVKTIWWLKKSFHSAQDKSHPL